MAEPAQEPRAFGRVSSLDSRAGLSPWWRETLRLIGIEACGSCVLWIYGSLSAYGSLLTGTA